MLKNFKQKKIADTFITSTSYIILIKKIKKYQVKQRSNVSNTQVFISSVECQVLLTPAFIFKESGEKTNS